MNAARSYADPRRPVGRWLIHCARAVIGQTCSTRLPRHADIPVAKVDGRVTVTGDQPDLVADPEPASGRDGKATVLVGGVLVGRGGLLADERRPRVEASAFRPGSTLARSSTLAHGFNTSALRLSPKCHRAPDNVLACRTTIIGGYRNARASYLSAGRRRRRPRGERQRPRLGCD